MEIIYRNNMLVAATLTAGSEMTITAYNPEPEAQLYLCVTDGCTGTLLAVSNELNEDNDFEATINLNTAVIFEAFSGHEITHRIWIEMELLDFSQRKSLAVGHGAMRNSTLLTGTSSAIPDVDTLISRSDFAEFDGSRPATVSQAYDQIARLIQILKGDKR